jgi:hypothetical protein
VAAPNNKREEALTILADESAPSVQAQLKTDTEQSNIELLAYLHIKGSWLV